MNVYMPAEAIVDRPRRRFLDWRFLSALTALALVGFLVYAGFRNYEARDAEAAQKQALIEELSERADQIEDLERDITALSKRARQDRLDASRERGQLLRQQARMIRLLQGLGITVPTAASTPHQPASSESTSGASSQPERRDQSAPPPQSSPKPKPSPEPGPKPTPPPDDPLGWLLPDLPLP